MQSRLVGADGVWYQWTGPVAAQCDGLTFIGWVTRQGSIIASSFDKSTGGIQTHTVARHFNADDHAAPALIVRQSDKRILFVYTKHNDPILRWRISTHPLDITSWGAEQTYTTERNCAYPQLAQLSGESGRIYVFFRHAIPKGDQRDWAFLTSDDGGQTFGNFKTLRTNFYSHGNGVLNPYSVISSDSVSRIDIASMNYEQLALGGTPNSIYHWFYAGGNFYKSDGTLICSLAQLPITAESQVTVVTSDQHVNLWDIVRGADGKPVIAWMKFDDYDSRHVAVVGKWTGSAWDVGPVANTGGPVSNNPGREWYSGGIALNRADPSEIYLSQQGGYGQFNIAKWKRCAGGWELAKSLEGDRTRKNFRPAVPLNADPDAVEVLFVSGAYQDLKDYGPTSIVAHPGPVRQSLRPSGFRGALRHSTVNQPLSGGATDIVFGKSEYDTDRFAQGATAFTIPPGIQAVRISAAIRFVAPASAPFINIVKNGVVHPGMAYSWSSGRTVQATSAVLLVEPGDEFRCRVNANGTTVEGHPSTWFAIEVVE